MYRIMQWGSSWFVLVTGCYWGDRLRYLRRTRLRKSLLAKFWCKRRLRIRGCVWSSVGWNNVTTVGCPTSDLASLCLKLPSLRPPVLLIRTVLRWRWVWNMGGMALAGENRSTSRKSSATATMSTTNPKLTGASLKVGLKGTGSQQPPGHGTAYLKTQINRNYI